MTRWLDEDELQAWLKLAGVMLKLSPALDSQLQRDSDLTHFDYLCLAMLSETEGRTLPMSELAARTNASLSRLSHVVSKLAKPRKIIACVEIDPVGVIEPLAGQHLGFEFALAPGVHLGTLLSSANCLRRPACLRVRADGATGPAIDRPEAPQTW